MRFYVKSKNIITWTKTYQFGMIRYGKYTEFSRGSFFCKLCIFYFHVPHIGVHKYFRLILFFDLLCTAIAHEVLSVSLVDSVTPKVDDERKDLAYSIYMWHTSCYILFEWTFYLLFMWFYMLFIYVLYTTHTHRRSRWRSKSGDQTSWRWSKNTFPQNCPGTFGVSFAIITGTQEQV